jgi:hypothetical protein
MKIRPVEEELFLADRRKDMEKLTYALRNFANAPKYDVKFLKHERFQEQNIYEHL